MWTYKQFSFENFNTRFVFMVCDACFPSLSYEDLCGINLRVQSTEQWRLTQTKSTFPSFLQKSETLL